MSYAPPPDPQQQPGQPGVPPPYDPNAAPPPPQGYGYPPPPQDYGLQLPQAHGYPPPPQAYGPPPQGYGYGQQPPPQWQAPNPGGVPRRGQSLCGAVGIGLGVLGILFIAATMVMMMPVVAATTPGQMPDHNDPQIQRMGMILQGGMCLNFLGLVVASFGFMEKDRGRATIWISYVINGLPCLCMCGAMGLGGVIMFAGLQ
jgi:hypothetical protein